jgi:hypothetical protein
MTLVHNQVHNCELNRIFFLYFQCHPGYVATDRRLLLAFVSSFVFVARDSKFVKRLILWTSFTIKQYCIILRFDSFFCWLQKINFVHTIPKMFSLIYLGMCCLNYFASIEITFYYKKWLWIKSHERQTIAI